MRVHYVLGVVVWALSLTACEPAGEADRDGHSEQARQQTDVPAAANIETSAVAEAEIAAATACEVAEEVVMHKIKDDYEYVRDSIKEAIMDRGIKINNISYIGKMLQRTAADVGAEKEVYSNGEAIEFCSATVSRDTMEADPHNIRYCPYIIAVYNTAEQPEVVYVTYRKPPLVGSDASKASLKAVGDLLDNIVNSALAGYQRAS